MAYVKAGALKAWIIYPKSRRIEIYGGEGCREKTSFAVDTAARIDLFLAELLEGFDDFDFTLE